MAPFECQRITSDSGQTSHPYYSPDGQWICYMSERGGINDEEPVVREVVFAPQMYGDIYLQRLSDGLTIRVQRPDASSKPSTNAHSELAHVENAQHHICRGYTYAT